jgi:O-antigen/teichoic acid export membrane protein
MILEQRQGVMARWYAISTAVHIVLALLLIPGYAAPAVGVARAVSMAVLLAQSCAYVERRLLASRPWRFVWRPALACGAMAFVVFVVTPAWSPFARAASGLAVYGLVLALLAALAGNRTMHEPPGELRVTWKASVAHPTLENHREQ